MEDDVEIDVLLVTLFGLLAQLFREINTFVILVSYGFIKLCRQSKCQNLGGLRDTRNVIINEQVTIFLTVLSHHTKNRVIKYNFKRSGYTISKHFNLVLNTLLKLHNVLLVTHEPVPKDNNDYRWKYFKGCLGALDDFTMDGNSDVPRGSRGRKGAGSTTHMVWTFAEECELMHALKELVLKGLESGYLLILENMLAAKFPRRISGLGLNSTTYRIDALPEVWKPKSRVSRTGHSHSTLNGDRSLAMVELLDRTRN
ncbi:hypothetical protein ACS0TY_012260 [Phlomoides rotata]